MCFAKPTQRQHMKELLASEEQANTRMFKSLQTAMQPLIRAGLEQALAGITPIVK
jgi:tRNA 2-thiocytidine biosynthesis protein TtcA